TDPPIRPTSTPRPTRGSDPAVSRASPRKRGRPRGKQPSHPWLGVSWTRWSFDTGDSARAVEGWEGVGGGKWYRRRRRGFPASGGGADVLVPARGCECADLVGERGRMLHGPKVGSARQRDEVSVAHGGCDGRDVVPHEQIAGRCEHDRRRGDQLERRPQVDR